MKRLSWRQLPSLAIMVACVSSGTLAERGLAADTQAAAKAAGAPDTSALMVQTGSDIPAHVVFPTNDRNYIKRDVMIPMRDGVKLHTVIVIPKDASGAPILLTRTPYHASARANRIPDAPDIRSILPEGDDAFVEGGYIRVFQDIRGKYGSEGDYVMTRPPRGPLNPTKTDETTDAWDTIEWLVHNIPESNGRVGMLGSSYEGYTVVMALLDPHPALKVTAPESPMVDGWMGDDWYHYGAFRQGGLDYFTMQMSERAEGHAIPRVDHDDYTNFLTAGSAGQFAHNAGLDQFPWWQRMLAHPTYDAFWQQQALDHLLARRKASVPTLWEQGLWDQEDMWGAIHTWQALQATTPSVPNVLVMGPWRHSQVNYNGSSLGPLQWNGNTASQFRHEVLRPFFDQYLRPGAAAVHLPEAIIYNTGQNHWDYLERWPLACDEHCPHPLQPFFVHAEHGLSTRQPEHDEQASDHYISDPQHPVPFLARPFSFVSDSDRWKTWLVQDQRFAESRPDVVTYETPVLTTPVKVSGVPVADLYAATTGTDADWVVKVIDVNPPTTADRPEMGGYELAVSMDIFRGRYRQGFDKPTAIVPGQPARYRFTLPAVNHVFEPGHRIMIQIQSSQFPLYDRNPQKFVPNILQATKEDYTVATQQIYHDRAHPTAVWLPVVP
ncbi:CocE/NonD family hydrolase [Gluconacetobacter entanii]|uniref:Glutaryl-7-ACA acylase n=1 Tax=Gluconacetobacter entanii TaxID=108528 RepID=A0A318PVK8_9PROT|nr:CocE/NonD family hydrolase [Gluconacetobacter entanii]MCE2577707.1 CocE/NonD family hydrolase [Komagataeibacter sp. FNDCR1]PYD64229.1 glutaryl-7-ACA acylase [Gluconacetobacter entanii]